MVRNPPNHILNQIAAGKFRLTPAHLAPRKVGPTTTLPPLFPPARVEALRQRLLRAGIDPVRVGGLPPPVAPSTAISVPSSATYKAACREIKRDYVEEQLVSMKDTVATWRQSRKEEARRLAAKKLPF